MYGKILVPLDGSDLAAQILPQVEELAKAFKSEITLITVGFLITLYSTTAEFSYKSVEDLEASLKKDAENRMLEDRIFAEKQINRIQREKHHAEIEHKNAELANSTLCLVNKNEILSEIKDKLKSSQKADTFHEVVQFINANTDIDQGWHKFRITFNEVHPGFFDRVQSHFSHLTDNDVRISAYLRINLSSREIARLMNVTLDATNKSRQRLRKKLDLPPEADLTEFLKSI